jgi:hypothetical protein
VLTLAVLRKPAVTFWTAFKRQLAYWPSASSEKRCILATAANWSSANGLGALLQLVRAKCSSSASVMTHRHPDSLLLVAEQQPTVGLGPLRRVADLVDISSTGGRVARPGQLSVRDCSGLSSEWCSFGGGGLLGFRWAAQHVGYADGDGGSGDRSD